MQARQSKRTRSLSNPGGVVGIVAYTPTTSQEGRFLHGRKETDDRARYGAAGQAEHGRASGAVFNALPDAEDLSGRGIALDGGDIAMDKYSRVKARLKAKRKTQAELAAYVGVAASTMNKKLNGVRPMGLYEAEKAATFLEIPEERFSEYFFNQ